MGTERGGKSREDDEEVKAGNNDEAKRSDMEQKQPRRGVFHDPRNVAGGGFTPIPNYPDIGIF
jgi:hypothetical protein